MSNEEAAEALTPEELARLRGQLKDQAVKLAISSRWEEAANLNREYLRTFGDEPEALNRLGKALSELGSITDARKMYGRSLEIEPTNTIARRNLDRLAVMRDTAIATAAPSQLDTRLFIEETGKAAVATLQAVDAERGSLLDAGDLVDLQVQGNAVNIVNINGEYIGMVEPRIGLRLSKMMQAGNQYSAALVTASGDLKVMIRETFQSPAMIGRVSFPQARATSEVRAYTRKGLLRGEDLEFDEDEGDYHDEEETGWHDDSADLADTGVEVDIETEDESFD